MSATGSSVPSGENAPPDRALNLALLGLACVAICILFLTAFVGFRPDRRSLSDRYFPSPTATASRTPTSTPTLTLTPTITSTPTQNLTATTIAKQATDTALVYQATATNAANEWSIILIDTFESNNNDWVVGSSRGEFGARTFSIEDGKYRWDATAHQGFIRWVPINSGTLDEFYLSIEVDQVSGPDSADYGVIFRNDYKDNFYYFSIAETGIIGIWLNFDGEWIVLEEWTDKNLIHTDEPNRLTVIGQGSQFIFFINNQYQTEITDERIKLGTTAMAIEIAYADQQATFEFDNLELRAP